MEVAKDGLPPTPLNLPSLPDSLGKAIQLALRSHIYFSMAKGK